MRPCVVACKRTVIMGNTSTNTNTNNPTTTPRRGCWTATLPGSSSGTPPPPSLLRVAAHSGERHDGAGASNDHHNHLHDGASVLARARASCASGLSGLPSSDSNAPAPAPAGPLGEGEDRGRTMIRKIREELQEVRRVIVRPEPEALRLHQGGSDEEEDDVHPLALETTIHPGTECCTRTSVQDGTLTIEASVGGLSKKDQIALAALAIKNTATGLFEQETRELRQQRMVGGGSHDELCHVLQHGRIVSSRPSDHASEFFHESYLVELEGNGRTIKALFKPKSEEGEESGWHRVGVEAVAYQLNLLLGMDLVPPTVIRRGEIIVDGRQFNEGSFTYFVEGARQLNESAQSVPDPVFLSNTRILDALIHNSDRHHGHFLHGKHWTKDQETAFLIDHAAGFRKEACVRMDHENAFLTGPCRVISARTYLHLRYLNHTVLETNLSCGLDLSEICELHRRKDAILDYFDGLVFFNGYDSVVVE
ncbi:hypothetical protein HOP50_10g61160 [Chloropicon primus]|uniref:PI3K/PI4K catalytic domain-containing protein n=1 Tax=Chloropicon primus TaxID=1764295 RepID=A0A5B8MTC6_9CHLO|nr:hypothetical protein A3770_10p60950 [Chloropicon primus]UPR02789.1 hypothetical protein HOP50_10g61160 [Chloropicon primus]|mmetsp:Transcript_14505/g.41323  ORF Transcript_14505/g.41323 Transcript_14505/m.41323 type:complete len:479 (-) Transcript_14505:98-1534(-)|eukprot:QDZ23577.1 hypothetical protein A3770_10p60950 [Chloropicon primus]